MAIDSADARYRASMATAYVSLALLAVTIALGPVTALRGRRYPVSTDVRRDFGIWTAIVAIVHVIVGLQVHLRGKMWEYFLHARSGSLVPRIDPFGGANYAGLAAVLLLVILLLTSNDASMRRFGSERWRRIHQLTPWAMMLTLVHGALYQFVEKRPWGYVMALGATAVVLTILRFARSRDPRN